MSKLQVDDIVNKEDNGSVGFSRGAVVTGVCTATSFSGGASGDFSIEDKIVHTSDTDTAIRFPAADTFTVETGGSERVRVTSAGKVGIGTENPDETLHVYGLGSAIKVDSNGDSAVRWATQGTNKYSLYHNDSANALIFFDNGNNAERIRIKANGRVGIGTDDPQTIIDTLDTTLPEFRTTAANKKLIVEEYGNANANAGVEIRKRFNDDSVLPANYWLGDIHFKGWDGDQFLRGAKIEAVVEGTPANNVMPCGLRFSTNSGGASDSERLRITPAGNVNIVDGNLVVASGHGIDFSATGTGTGTDTSELLDDYEEGTWTPNVGGNATYTSQSGSYTKIGRSVTARFQFTINVLGTGSNQRIENLPFAVAGSNVGECAGPVSYFANLHTARGSLTCYAGSSTNRVYFNSITGDAAAMGINQVVFQNSTVMWGTVTYFTN